MATADEARAAVVAARADLSAALAGAAGGWNTKPAGGEGEEAWSAQEVAAHVIPADLFFARAACKGAGVDGPANPIKGALITTPQEATAALQAVAAATDATVAAIGAEDMGKDAHESFGTVEGVFGVWAGHIRDHAAQIRAAARS